MASVDYYYVVFWNITNNFTIIKSINITGYFCNVTTWSLNNLLKCVDVNYTTRTLDPITGLVTIIAQVNYFYPLTNILYYPFAVSSYEMFLFTHSN